MGVKIFGIDMKVVCMSDLHGTLPLLTENFDLLLLPGDVCPVWNHRREFQLNWLKAEFTEWIKNLPYKDENSKVILCAGNHDFVFENISKAKLNSFIGPLSDRLVYLDNEEYVFEHKEDGEIKKYRIFATPYCKQFGGWAFMREPEKLEQYYSFIPEGLDFLMSHDSPQFPPIGVITEGHYKGIDAGNPQLAAAILEKKPKWCVFGHIHSGTHEINVLPESGIHLANVAMLNEAYELAYSELIIEYKKPQE